MKIKPNKPISDLIITIVACAIGGFYGTYFRTQDWRREYVEYRTKHPFTKPVGKNMKADLFGRFRRKKTLCAVIIFMVLTIYTSIKMFSELQWWQPVAIIIFGFFLVLYINDFTGKPVRKFLKSGIDYTSLDYSYMNGKMLNFKENGIIFGVTHIHVYTENYVCAIDYGAVEDITRRIVRVKKYENSIYSGNDFKYYAVVHVRIPESENTTTKEVELNEYQVQMAIDEFSRIKYVDKND